MISRKLRKRLTVTIISILSCIAVMAVGVYAAQSSFEVQVSNQIDIDLTHVDGTLSGKRYGDVICGDVSRGDEGIADAGLVYSDDLDAEGNINGIIPEFITLYSNEGDGYRENAENMAKIKENVNFYLSAVELDSEGNKTETKKTELTIYYVFKFVFNSESPTNVEITLTNNTTELASADPRADKVTQNYKYCFSTDEPSDWSTTGLSFGVESAKGASKKIVVKGSDSTTHTVYIMASLTVQRTATLADAYTLGIAEDYTWAFSLTMNAVNASTSSTN